MSNSIKVSALAKVENPLPDNMDFMWVAVDCWWETPDEKTDAHPSVKIEVPVSTSEVDSDSIQSLTDKAREKARKYLKEALHQL
jgi:hypothetical protein